MDDNASTVTRSGFRIGRVRGIPVMISPSWLILAVLITVVYSDVVRALLPGYSDAIVYLVSFGFVVTLCGSVFLHELGHALVSLHYGIPVRRITLEMLGGHTEMSTEADRPKVEALIALAGPAVSAVLGVIGIGALALTEPGTLPGQFAFQIAVCNVLVAIYNALPGLPLDGGRALRAGVWAVTGDRHAASRIAGWTGRVVAAATGLLGVTLFYLGWLSLIGVIFTVLIAGVLWVGATRSIQLGQLGSRFHLLDTASLMRPVVEVPGDTPLAEALRRMKEDDAGGVVVVDASGNPVSLLHSEAAEAVPAGRRPWIPVADVSRAIDERNSWPLGLRGEDVIAAMREHPSTEYAVLSGPSVRGVVRMADVADALDPRLPAPAPRRARPADGAPTDDQKDTD
ncbi:M50 family metallopeptidase [Stackebrandtia soli]|uniref:M50 family metallopeptidase n=1 Tax=Stackebrandtia soli TaxID=1892856 RepID=UPI0039E7BBC1